MKRTRRVIVIPGLHSTYRPLEPFLKVTTKKISEKLSKNRNANFDKKQVGIKFLKKIRNFFPTLSVPGIPQGAEFNAAKPFVNLRRISRFWDLEI